MIVIGTFQELVIVRQQKQGMYLEDTDKNEVLLPNKYIEHEFQIGDHLEVFVYLDQQQRPIATTRIPYCQVNSFAFLRCVSTTKVGAFLDWGLEKHLFVPFAQQVQKMREGEFYLVYVYLDAQSKRLVASSRTNSFLSNQDTSALEINQRVELIASHPSTSGWNMIVESKYKGLAYHDEIYCKISVGDRLEGSIKKIREDGKIDLYLQAVGVDAIDEFAQLILDELEANDGYLDITDKTDADRIRTVFGLSKKSFKKGLGRLFKKRQVQILENGIKLA